MSIDRIPPHSLDAEQAVLGSMLIERQAVEKAAEILKPNDFYRDAHRYIFEAMLTLAEQDEPVDLITLSDELRARGHFEMVGGLIYLQNLMEAPATAANVEYYAKLVEEKAILRRLLDAGTQIQGLAYNTEFESIDDVVNQAERMVMEIGQRRMGQYFYHLRPLLNEELDRIEKRYENRGAPTGRLTPFDDLNYKTAGLQPSDLIIVAARPGMGKCLRYDALIDDPTTGERLTIEECVRRRLPAVLGVDACGRVRPATVSDWVDSGVQPCFRVRTRLGRSVEVTGHHPFLTAAGWRPLHDLSVGDCIAVPRRVPIFGHDTSYDPCLVRLTAAEKRFPACIWKLDRCGLAEFLRVLFSCDGTIYALKAEGKSGDRNRYPRIEFTVASQGLAEDVQHALTRFGVVSKLWRKTAKSWRVEITDPASAAIYQDEINWIGEKATRFSELDTIVRRSIRGHAPREVWTLVREAARRKGLSLCELARRAGETIDGEGYNSHTNRSLPLNRLAAYAEVLDDDGLRLIAGPDLYWDELVEIAPTGEHQVYDLTVPDGSNFLAQDLCVHNTTLTVQLAQHIALEENIPVAIFSLEMSKEQLVTRMICSESKVDSHRLRTGMLHNDDWQRVGEGISRLAEAPIYIDDTPDVSIAEMRTKCRRLKAENKGNLGLIVIDYLQLMRSHKKTENRNQEISEIARACKGLARELRVPVIALSQLSRAVESRPDKRPMLSDLRESGSIEAEADIVMFIYREAYYKMKEAGEKGEGQDMGDDRGGDEQLEETELIIAKHRSGPTGKVFVGFLPKYTRFENLDRTHVPDE